jgi:uncharacterized protein involved in exopolysaccharide biosynthesis
VGKRKEEELQEAIERQKKHVLELNRQRDQISVLQRDVEAAQRNFEAVSQRSAHTRLESLAVQTNIAVLNPASIPVEHASPRILFNTIISIFLGTLGGVGLALIFELLNRRVRSVEDLAEMIELPVLAIVSSKERTASRKTTRKLFHRAAPTRALGMEVPEH